MKPVFDNHSVTFAFGIGDLINYRVLGNHPAPTSGKVVSFEYIIPHSPGNEDYGFWITVLNLETQKTERIVLEEVV